MESVDKLVEDNAGLVYAQLHKFNRAYDDDAISYAFEGLWNAAKTYDSSKKVAFSTYASVCIYNSIGCYLRSIGRQSSVVIIPLEEPISDDNNLLLIDTISSDDTLESDLLKRELYVKLYEAFDAVRATLPVGVSQDIIDLWRESDFTATQRELANATGVSQAHVSRTLSAFKHKLKQEMEDYLCER